MTLSTHKSAHDPQQSSPATTKNWWWVSVSYFAEGLPWSMLHQVAAEFFTSIGARPSQVGRTALLHIPILLKVVLSPVVQGVSTLRNWMLWTQLLMGLVMGGVALLAHRVATFVKPEAADSFWLWVLLFSIGILSAIYDIACDGFYLENLDEQEQARYSGLRVAVYRVAMLFGSFLLVFLGGLVHWLLSFSLAAALLIVLSAVLSRTLPRDNPLGLAAAQRSVAAPKAEPYLSFLRQESIGLVVLFLLFYKAADAMMFSMSPVLLSRHLGMDTEIRASLGVFSTIAGIFGAIWGGAWVAKRGLERAMFPITFLMVITEPLYVFMAVAAPSLALNDASTFSSLNDLVAAGPQLLIVTLILIIEKLCAGLAVAAQTIFIMRRCHPDHKTAHYAFATVIYSLSQIALGSFSGYLFEGVGPTTYYVIVSLLALPTLLLVRLVPLTQRVRS